MTNVIDINSAAWVRGLQRTEEGFPTKTVGNATLFLTHSPEFAGCIRFDTFAKKHVWSRIGPTIEGFTPPPVDTPLADEHWIYVAQWLLKNQNLKLPKQGVIDATEASSKAHSFHPLQDWLRSLTWDGRVRLPGWLHCGLGAPATDYTDKVGTWWAISAVARALRPGCQADHMLVLEGQQGSGKSSALRALCPKPDWFLFKLPNLRDYERAAHAIQGKWLGEIGELDALRGAASTAIKEFLTLTQDTFRAPYAHYVVTVPRSIVLAGSTNEKAYLEDPSGARRFWPFPCGAIDTAWLLEHRDQLWAEAVVRFDQGERYWPAQEDHAGIEAEQGERYHVDEWERLIADWAELQPAEFTMGAVLSKCLSVPPERWDRASQIKIGHILTRLGYERKRHRVQGDALRREYRYGRPCP